MQVNLTPFGAHRLLNVSLRELCARTVDVAVVLGAEGEALVEQLGNDRTWTERFARLDAFLCARLTRAQRGDDISTGMRTVWDLLSSAGGNVRIDALLAATAWSNKRLIAVVRDYTGLSPKRLARVMRFEHTLRHMQANDDLAWTQRALASGYYDQAHLIRDFSAFAGCTPTEYLRRRLPPGGGVLGDVP
jgi:AraC-like DNA-binding protein